MTMPKYISIFNNKGGVGKTTISWNISEYLAEKGKKILLIDFDPQCNLSIAMLGKEVFGKLITNNNIHTIRSFLQPYLQSSGPGALFLHNGIHTHKNVHLVAGDFWLNIYSESINVGNDLLTGNGINKFLAPRIIGDQASLISKINFDYVIIDIPPSFGGLVRSALYSSNYLIIPCTSDNFSEYCIGLIGNMLPQFILDWQTGINRFKLSNNNSNQYDSFGSPVFGGWIFNGYDTRNGSILRGDHAHQIAIKKAISDFIIKIRGNIKHYNPSIYDAGSETNIGMIEDMNVIAQNSLWQNIPISIIDKHPQVKDITGGKSKWSAAQLKRISEIQKQIASIGDNIISRL